MKPQYKVGIVGATGAVGREVLKTLAQRKFPIQELRLFSSARSAGKTIQALGEEIKLREAKSGNDFEELDFVFFTAGSSVSEKLAPLAAEAGAWVIDNSSRFRMEKHVPLVVPEVNGHDLERAQSHRLVANPNCTTAQMVMALKPLHDAFQIKRIVLASYQAVSGKGQSGIEEFTRQVHDFVENRKAEAKAFPHPIAFNCLPHIDVFRPDGFTGEEHKVMEETRKIMGNSSLRVVATCVRVPVINCHSESVTIETEKPVSVEEAKDALRKMPGVKVWDDPSKNVYPLAMDVSGKDEVYVGRLRRDPSVEHGLTFWVVADNLRKGAALNAVQIAEAVLERGLHK